jgi:hypothetical protein
MKKLLIAASVAGLMLSGQAMARDAIANASELANNALVDTDFPISNIEIYNDTLDQWNSVRVANAADLNDNVVCNAVGSSFRTAAGHKCVYEGGHLVAICMQWDGPKAAKLALEGGGDHDLMYSDGATRGSRICHTSD